MEDMSTGDKINICRRPEISGNMTVQAPYTAHPAKKYLGCEFFLPHGWRVNICRTKLQNLRVPLTKNGPVMKDRVCVIVYIVNQIFSESLFTGSAKFYPTGVFICNIVVWVGGRVRVTVRC